MLRLKKIIKDKLPAKWKKQQHLKNVEGWVLSF
jgi:hypothetical protein